MLGEQIRDQITSLGSGLVVMEKPEKRYAEFRAETEGRKLIGTLVKYGDTAHLPGGVLERFDAGRVRRRGGARCDFERPP